MHHPTKYTSTQLNRGTCHPQTRVRTHTHTTPHNTPSMTCSLFGPTRGSRFTRTWPAWLADCSLCRRLLPSWRGTFASTGFSLRVPGAAYPRPTRKCSCSSTEISNTFPLKCRLSQLSTCSRRYLAVSLTRRRRWSPISVGEAGSAGEAGVNALYDEYAGEAGPAGEEGVNAGCGDSAGEGLH